MKTYKQRTADEAAQRIRDKIMEELRPLLRYDGDLSRFTEAARICAAHGVNADFFESGGRPPVN